jgi:hypothetical protein
MEHDSGEETSKEHLAWSIGRKSVKNVPRRRPDMLIFLDT